MKPHGRNLAALFFTLLSPVGPMFGSAAAQTAETAPSGEVQAAPTVTEPEPRKADIARAVTCQVLVSQFDDGVAAAKIDDAAKTAARALRGEGNKACGVWDYDGGIGALRTAIAALGRQPVR
jgi:hypothetical protein